MSEDGGPGVGQCPGPGRGVVVLGEEPHRKPHFEDVHEGDGEGGFPPQNPVGVGGPQVSASDSSEVHSEDEPAHPEAGRSGADDIRQKEEKYGSHFHGPCGI